MQYWDPFLRCRFQCDIGITVYQERLVGLVKEGPGLVRVEYAISEADDSSGLRQRQVERIDAPAAGVVLK